MFVITSTIALTLCWPRRIWESEALQPFLSKTIKLTHAPALTAWCICRNMVAIVGDHCDVFLHDMSSRRAVQSLQGHLDWSFAVSWHPNGNLLATGNQDCTTRLWDIRNPAKALDVLPSTMGSVRACRFSPDGLSLAVSEPADFVHVYDIKSGMAYGQDIDFFGEISGISFDPSSSLLFIGIPDRMYNSVLCYKKAC
jgi:WD40 repeat protein